MNINDMTNEQIRSRIALIKELRELETGSNPLRNRTMRDPSKWYPDDRNWVEHSPENPVDRSKVVDILYDCERDELVFYSAPSFNDYVHSEWNPEFNWECGKGNIVAAVLKD